MNKLFQTAVIALMLAPSVGVTQDFDAGLAAAKVGDYATALRELTPLAEQGNPSAQFNLGLMYANGYGVGQDVGEATKWFRLATKSDEYPLVFFGYMYHRGIWVPQDHSEAAKWYRLAAEQGNVSAQYNLGTMYKYGTGVLKDYTETVRWHQRAAAQGDELAQINLGNMYEYGKGVPRDYVTAHMWYNVASDNGLPFTSTFRELLGDKMTSSDIAEAQRRARVCMASNYQDCD